ncbi:MAG TPA: carboxy terminal-processing peptidase [Gemmataceae bacterium]|nr:carboxy terminal-processing peptidase [Gemmataceae bacterium]
MTQRIVPVKRTLALFVVLAGLLGMAPRLAAEPVPGRQDRLVVQMVCSLLQQGHLSRPEIGDELSRRLFRRFFKEMDPSKLYFLQTDVDELKKYETQLDDMLLEGDLSFAYKVYDRFLQRLGQRIKLVEELIEAPHDFKAQEYLETDFDAMDFPRTDSDVRERWRKRIKFDLLLQRLAQKPLPEAEAKKKVLQRYQDLLKRWKQLDNYDLMEMYLSDLTASVDPHSSYMSAPTLDDFDIAMRLSLEGIGALLRSESGQTIVAEVIPGGAAAQDGRLKQNDKIVAVAQGDGQFVDVVDMKLREVVKLIRGPRGTKVQLRVIPAEKVAPVVYDLTRRKIELKSQEARQEILEQGKKPDGSPYRIGVIDLPSFYAEPGSRKNGQGDAKSATEDVRKILKEFTAKGVDGVVLDLRKNGGGALNEALALTGLFIDQGTVVQVKGSQGPVQRLKDPEKGTVYAGPLMVLVSRYSASASEILAGALQDYGRALIVGDSSTHGKGTVQALLDLGSQIAGNRVGGGTQPKLGALKLTVQQFYRVNGDSTQNRGVLSDIVLPSLSEVVATTEKEMDHALAFDQVKPAEHQDLGMVPLDVKAALQARSAERVKNSAEFAKLAKEIELLKTRRARKAIPLNEAELREQFTKDEAEKVDQRVNGLFPPETPDTETYKFQRNFVNDEVLHIMEDFIQGKKLAQSR